MILRNALTIVSSVAACVVLLAVSPSVADTFHVAPPPTGSDGHPGTEIEPWATLQHAADQVAAGDTVIVHAGDYVGMYLDTSGTASLPIVFRAAPGDRPRVTSDNATTPDGINIEGADHVTIEGFQVDGRGRAGIRAVLCEHVTIRDNHLDANERWGILTGFCDDLLIEGNIATNSIIEHGIYVSNSGDRPVVRGNRLVGNAANGLHMNGDRFAGGDGIISDALVEDNVILDNGTSGGSGINCDGVQNSLIRNNLIHASHASGLSLYQIDGGAPSIGNRVFHNTILVASDGRWGINIQDGSTGNTVKNNIVYSRHGFRGAMSVCASCLTGFVSDHNVVEDRFTLDDGSSVLTLAQWRSATGQDMASAAVADPDALFVDSDAVDLEARDHHLVAGVAVDFGEVLVDVPTDLDGTARPLGAAPDAGCYEGIGVLFSDGFDAGHADAWSARVP
ncbi:MAG: right-handed parallel beta-helix repeat-containing protein [Acidobacteriota bacterium]